MLTARQRRFCQYYAEGKTGPEAARLAGYSETAAAEQASRLLKNADVLAEIGRLRDEIAAPEIARIAEIRALWSSIMRDPEAKNADRLRAGELLARSMGTFLSLVRDDTGRRLAFEGGGDDVVIYLPQVDRGEGLNDD